MALVSISIRQDRMHSTAEIPAHFHHIGQQNFVIENNLFSGDEMNFFQKESEQIFCWLLVSSQLQIFALK